MIVCLVSDPTSVRFQDNSPRLNGRRGTAFGRFSTIPESEVMNA